MVMGPFPKPEVSLRKKERVASERGILGSPMDFPDTADDCPQEGMAGPSGGRDRLRESRGTAQCRASWEPETWVQRPGPQSEAG